MKEARFILPLILMIMFLSSVNIFAAEVLTAEDYYNIGLTFFDESNYSEAINNYEKAFELDPTYARAYLGLGDIYYYQKNMRKPL